MNDEDRKAYASLDENSKTLFKLLKKYMDGKFEEANSSLASLDAHIITITSSETFQKIISDELDKSVNKEGEKKDDTESNK